MQGFDLVPAALTQATSDGVTVVESAVAAVKDADTVVTMLPNGRLVLGLYEDLLPAAAPGTLFIDSSTIDVADAHAAHKLVSEAGHRSLDAPVSGGVGGAAAGTLTFMVGGSEADFDSAAAVLDVMGRKVVHCGAAGNGQAAKVCNNMILGVSMIAVSEAFVLAEKLGLDAQKLYDISSKSSGQCWSMTTYCPVPGPVPTSPANRDYKAGFTAAMMLKDLKLAQDAAKTAGAETPLGADAAKIYDAFVEAGEGPRDFSGVIRYIRGR